MSYWNKEKGYSTHDRTCIGKKGPGGKPVYNKHYKTREEIQALTSEVKTANETLRIVSSTTFIGERLILDKASGETKIARFLKESFGERDGDKIMALAYYQIRHGKALSNAEDWLYQRGFGDLRLSSQRVSELLERLQQDKINTFFKSWAGKHSKGGNLLFDLTGVNTYGKRNAYAEYGYNRDGENLEQINLTLLTSCGSELPIWYQMLQESMSDRVILDNVLSMMKKMEVPKFTFVGDHGFYS